MIRRTCVFGEVSTPAGSILASWFYALEGGWCLICLWWTWQGASSCSP